MFRPVPILCAVFLALELGAALASGGEMSREAKAAFLKAARVVSMGEVGEGVTHSMVVVLDEGTTRRKAIFKTVDLRMKTQTRFGAETAEEYIDSYKYEIAAYELDKLLGVNIVPVTVERKINGKRGSLQEWIDGVISHYGHGESPPDMDRTRDQIHTVWLFDYLIYNVDRHTDNLMFGRGWVPVVIDHSMSFRTFERPSRPLYRFPQEAIDRLRTLDSRRVKKVLKRYLKRRQIEALMRRREIVLEAVDREVAERGETAVFFSLSRIAH